MNMFKWRRNKGKAPQAEEAGAGAGADEKRRLWVICGTFLVAGVVVLAHNVLKEQRAGTGAGTGGEAAPGNSMFRVWGQYWARPPPPLPPSPAAAREAAPSGKNWHNLLVEESTDYESTLAEYLRRNATAESPCYGVRTNSVRVEGLPEPRGGGNGSDLYYYFETDVMYRFTIVAYDEWGQRRCAGGDYFETNFHDRGGAWYRARLPTVDQGNGSYVVELSVPSRFAGRYTLEIWLLFSNWHGMDFGKHWSADSWNQTLDFMLAMELQMGKVGEEGDGDSEPIRADDERRRRAGKRGLRRCEAADFDRTTWQGRWTRSWYNATCEADELKRFRCLPPEQYGCEAPWCFGQVGRLDSNGWHYSAHCGMKIFEAEEAWRCLDGKWFLFWGDSNVQDSVRNLALFVLDWDLPLGQTLAGFQLARNYQMGFVNPRRLEQMFRVSQVFNGHHVEFDNGEGFKTVTYPAHREAVLAHFNGSRWPDVVYMNSGLHDGWQHRTVEEYSAAADVALLFWMDIYASLPRGRKPLLVWRTTVAPAGNFRKMQSNVNKMEMYNLIMVEKLQRVRHVFPVKIIDGFDLTFPFHYDNECSDGGHYGRMPGANVLPWWGRPHWYFVDIMLMHIFLNIACPS